MSAEITIELLIEEGEEGLTEIVLAPEWVAGRTIYRLGCRMIDLGEGEDEGGETGIEEEGEYVGEVNLASEQLISPAEVEAILAPLQGVALQPLPADAEESDEPHYILTLVTGSTEARYSWQGEPPPEWRPLGELSDRLTALADKRCNQQGAVFKILAHPVLE